MFHFPPQTIFLGSPPTSPLLSVLSSHFLGNSHLATRLLSNYNEADTPGSRFTTMSYSSLSMGFFIFCKCSISPTNHLPRLSPTSPMLSVLSSHVLGNSHLATILSKTLNAIDTPGFPFTAMSYSSLPMGFQMRKSIRFSPQIIFLGSRPQIYYYQSCLHIF